MKTSILLVVLCAVQVQLHQIKFPQGMLIHGSIFTTRLVEIIAKSPSSKKCTALEDND